MSSWRISCVIENLKLSENNNPEIIDNVAFHLFKNQVVGTVKIEDEDRERAILKAKQMIDRAVTRLCYSYERQISIGNGVYVTDLVNPSSIRVQGELRLLWDVGMDVVQDTRIAKLKNIVPNKQEVTDKVLGLYKIAQEIKDPFKAVDSYLSCIHAALKDIFSPEIKLKQGIKDIISKRNKNFDEQKFNKTFADCYGRWRSKSSHGGFRS